MQRDADHAIECYRKAIQIDEAYAMAYRNLARALREKGLPIESGDADQRAWELDSKQKNGK